MATESVKDLMRKILELAKRGVGGEADAAQRKLDALLEKYGMTLADIETVALREYVVTYRDELDERMLMQIYAALVCRRDIFIVRRGGKKLKKLMFQLSPAEYIDFQEMVRYYRAAFKKERERLFQAFIHKHHLLAPAAEDSDESNVMSDQEYLDLVAMMRSLREKSFIKPSKQIEHGGCANV